jgi:hypothetical protein
MSAGATEPAQRRDEIAGSDACAGALDAMRAFGVAFGGSVVLDLAALWAAASTANALGHRRRPHSAAIAGVAATVAYATTVRPWMRRWGATSDELTKPLPGDELVPDAQIQFTRAVTVDVPPEGVWPWLAQIGQDRGGFYSYAFLENLAGCRLHNAARIHAEWQHREIGEELPLHWAHGMRIAAFEPGRMLAIDGWGAFVIEPRDGSRTSRLLARARMRRGTASVFYALVVEIPHFVMERKMLLGIRQRAENSAKPLGHRRDRSLRRHVRVT